MKILGLYNNECAVDLFTWLKENGNEVICSTEKLEAQWCAKQRFDLTISYTYRYILSKEVLDALGNNAVNIHNSFLPFNRGADPNIWSIIDETPRGVTLHYMNTDLDKGFIIAQQLVNDSEEETLRSSYENLDRAAKQLFKDAFRYYKSWPMMRKQALGEGSYHSIKDGERLKKTIISFDESVWFFKEKLDRNHILCN